MWKITTLGDICKMYQPKTISKKEMKSSGKYFVYGANGIIGKYNKYNHSEPQLLITCRGATCGSVNISQPFSWINGNAMVIQPDTSVVSLKFMEYLFKGGLDLSKAITGSAQPQITRVSLNTIKFSYPPIPEQQRIVAKLDAVSTEIEKSIKATEDKIYITKTLFQNHLKRVFDISGKDIVKETIGNVCKLRSGTTINSKLEKNKGELPYLKVADMNLILNKNSIKTSSRFVNKSDININSIVRKGSTIFPKRGGAIDTNKKRITDLDIIVDLNIMSVCPDDKLHPLFLYYYFLSLDMRKLGSGSSIRQINNYDIEPIFISFPKSIQNQKEIVDKISSIKTYCEKLVNCYKLKKLELDSLKKIIIKKSFFPKLSNIA